MARESLELRIVSRFPVLVAAVALLGLTVVARAQKSRAAVLPPIAFACPMDPDVIADHAGTCPRCGMALAPVRLDTAYSCPLHPAVIETKPGACGICRRRLVAVTVSLFWTCADHPEVHALAPGSCTDGRPRTAARERRAHGDHNPRHGGQFFMASDNWHHLEGTYPQAGVFRVFVYDDFTRPISLGGITARVTAEASDPARRADTTAATIALKPSAAGRYLEARVPLMLPAQVSASIRFAAGGPEHRFDFQFAEYTKEPAPGAKPTAATRPAVQLESADPDGRSTKTTVALTSELQSQREQVDALLKQGALAELYIPALAAKNTALALDAHANELSDDRRAAAAAAVKHIVLAAWAIDRYGDLGDRQKLDEAYRSFSEGVTVLVDVYGTR
jgi:hypothetical protein